MRILGSATTVLRRIVDVALISLIVIVLLGVVLGKGAPFVGRQSIVIGGGSMEPAIHLGSAIVVRPVDPATLAVGDIVSMQIGPERTMFTHRIVDVVDRPDGRWIRTRGDANAEPDPTLVPATAIIGRVELSIPYAGYLLALLSLPVGVIFVLGLAATLLAMAWLLESLEPDPRPRRRRTESDAPAADPGWTAGGGAPALEGAVVRGEPIAVRPTWVAAAMSGSGGSGASGRAAASLATISAGPSSVARPTIREQLERSREVRRRRARWSGRQTGPTD
jgi:signal peptidase